MTTLSPELAVISARLLGRAPGEPVQDRCGLRQDGELGGREPLEQPGQDGGPTGRHLGEQALACGGE